MTTTESLSSDSVPSQLIENYVMRYAGYAKKKPDGVINAGCPTCKEDNGKYWGKRARLYYIPNQEGGFIYCHNCGRSWKPLDWMSEVSGKSKEDIKTESEDYDYIFLDNSIPSFQQAPKREFPELPRNSIKLTDSSQVAFYGTNNIVQYAINEIKRRRLDTAVNKCDLYISLDDDVHQNRLCIPFIDTNNKIVYYQTRALFSEDEKDGKYLGKYGSEKGVFGLNNVKGTNPKMFVTEGPIDSMFIRNGVAMAGLSMTTTQSEMINSFIGRELIWIIDNQFDNIDVIKDYEKLIKRGEIMFMWGEEFKGFKDVNEYCVTHKLDEFPQELIMKNVLSGAKAMLALKERIKECRK